MRSAARVLAARSLYEKSFLCEAPKHPRRGWIGQSEEAPRVCDRHAQARHLFELRPNAIDGRLPQKIGQPVWTTLPPGM